MRRDKEMGLVAERGRQGGTAQRRPILQFRQAHADQRRQGLGERHAGSRRLAGRVQGRRGASCRMEGPLSENGAARRASSRRGTRCGLPTAQRKQALLAVAHTNRDTAETYITLFDVASGRPLRQFTGHLQDVRWLAFSDTHPLLVSASEDQTVRVWSFADLNAGVGMIEGWSSASATARSWCVPSRRTARRRRRG